jgi:hypothetical protein
MEYPITQDELLLRVSAAYVLLFVLVCSRPLSSLGHHAHEHGLGIWFGDLHGTRVQDLPQPQHSQAQTNQSRTHYQP